MKHKSMKHLQFAAKKGEIRSLYIAACDGYHSAVKSMCSMHNDLFPWHANWARSESIALDDLILVFRHLSMYAQDDDT